jgi:hypothetical protein
VEASDTTADTPSSPRSGAARRPSVRSGEVILLLQDTPSFLSCVGASVGSDTRTQRCPLLFQDQVALLEDPATARGGGGGPTLFLIFLCVAVHGGSGSSSGGMVVVVGVEAACGGDDGRDGWWWGQSWDCGGATSSGGSGGINF